MASGKVILTPKCGGSASGQDVRDAREADACQSVGDLGIDPQGRDRQPPDACSECTVSDDTAAVAG